MDDFVIGIFLKIIEVCVSEHSTQKKSFSKQNRGKILAPIPLNRQFFLSFFYGSPIWTHLKKRQALHKVLDFEVKHPLSACLHFHSTLFLLLTVRLQNTYICMYVYYISLNC